MKKISDNRKHCLEWYSKKQEWVKCAIDIIKPHKLFLHFYPPEAYKCTSSGAKLQPRCALRAGTCATWSGVWRRVWVCERCWNSSVGCSNRWSRVRVQATPRGACPSDKSKYFSYLPFLLENCYYFIERRLFMINTESLLVINWNRWCSTKFIESSSSRWQMKTF